MGKWIKWVAIGIGVGLLFFSSFHAYQLKAVKLAEIESNAIGMLDVDGFYLFPGASQSLLIVTKVKNTSDKYAMRLAVSKVKASIDGQTFTFDKAFPNPLLPPGADQDIQLTDFPRASLAKSKDKQMVLDYEIVYGYAALNQMTHAVSEVIRCFFSTDEIKSKLQMVCKVEQIRNVTVINVIKK